MVLEQNDYLEKVLKKKYPVLVSKYSLRTDIDESKTKSIIEVSYIKDKYIYRKYIRHFDIVKYANYKVLSSKDGYIYEFNDFKNIFNTLTKDVKDMFMDERRFLLSLNQY